jgi:hypothetical protein
MYDPEKQFGNDHVALDKVADTWHYILPHPPVKPSTAHDMASEMCETLMERELGSHIPQQVNNTPCCDLYH